MYKNLPLFVLKSLIIMTIYLNLSIAQSQYNPSIQNQPSDLSLSDVTPGTVVGQPEKYLFVEKTIYPQKEFYSLNESIRVYVEIKSMRFINPEATLDDICIDEIIGNGLKIINKSSKCYIISNIMELAKYQNSLDKMEIEEESLKGFPLSYNNSLLHLELPGGFKIRGNDRIVFWYNITPELYGILSTKTVIGSKIYSKLDYSFMIKVKKAEPIFSITVTTTKSKVYQFEDINLLYNIVYLGDSDIYETSSVSTDGASQDGYFRYKNDYNMMKNFLFKRYETLSIPKTIEFPFTGEYYPPGITLEGVHYTFDKPLIIVDTPITRNGIFLNSIYLIFGIIGAISSAIVAYLKLFLNYTWLDIYRIAEDAIVRLMESSPQLIRVIVALVLISITTIYALNLEYIKYITFLTTHAIYIIGISVSLFIIVYDFMHNKSVFIYWILLLIFLIIYFLREIFI